LTTEANGDVEALALAVPTDHLGGGTPPTLLAMYDAARRAYAAARIGAWSRASAAAATLATQWAAHPAGVRVPPRLVRPTGRAVTRLGAVVSRHQRDRARDAALLAELATLDLELQYRAPAAIDRDRFNVWTHRVVSDAAAHNVAGVRGDGI